MQILSNKNGEENIIAKKLKEISPHTIAVAYVGNDWKEYCTSFKEIILSPTYGSNPNAINDIINAIGIQNVYFIDNLHSKIYLGKSSALVGSNNLSNNALSDFNLLETAIVVDTRDGLSALETTINGYKLIANRLYPTKERKLQQLEILRKLPKSPYVNFKSTDILEYNLDNSNKRIIIAWHGNTPIVYNEKCKSDFNEDEDDYNTFLEQDEVLPGDWILNWKITDNDKPDKSRKITWLKVTNLVSHGDINEANFPYTKIAYQKYTKTNAIPPFVVDDKIVSDCFKKLMEEARFSDFWQDDQITKVWTIQSKERTNEFLGSWQNEVRKARGIL